MININTEAQLNSAGALLGVLYKFGFIKVDQSFDGAAMWFIPRRWNVKGRVEGNTTTTTVAFDLNYSRRKFNG